MVTKIVIDPGHGGDDPGAEGFGLQEKNINLDIARQIRAALTKFAEITLTRNTDTFISLSERAAIANRIEADLFVSIHVNAGGGTGFESYTINRNEPEAETIRAVIHKEMVSFYGTYGFADRGMKKANFAVLRETKMPSVLLENLFIDKDTNALKLKQPEFRQAIAQAAANGIINALKLDSTLVQPPASTETAPAWTIENFTRIRNAGLVMDQHDLNSPVTWGEMSAVLARLLDRLNL